MYAAHLYILKAVSPIPGRRAQRGEVRREVAEEGSLFEEPVAAHRRSALPHIKDRLNHLIHVALGTKPAGYRKVHQLYRCTLT